MEGMDNADSQYQTDWAELGSNPWASFLSDFEPFIISQLNLPHRVI